MSQRSDNFTKQWVFENVHNNPASSFQDEIARLVAKLKGDAASAGIGKVELDETIGDADDYVTHEYENVYNPDAGGIR